MNIVLIIVFVIEAIIGVASTAYLIISLFATLASKIIRKVKYNIPLYD